jgi:amino acid adenylation domain-containing protein/non-ribosomal peptide synthase protein (TIGR01720 family)
VDADQRRSHAYVSPLNGDLLTTSAPAATLPLTAAQLTLWFDETYMDDCGLHTMGDCLEIRGVVDVDRLLATMQLTMNEVDAVRARYRLADNRPVQDVAEHVEIPVEFFDFEAGSTDAQRVAQAWDDMNAHMDRRMDITRPPLMFVVLYQIAEEHLLVLSAMHHIVADGYSRTAVFGRWCELYNGGPGAGTPLPPLSTLLEAEADYRVSPGLAADERYWAREVATLPERVSLSTGGSEPGRARLRTTITVEPGEVRRLRALVEDASVTWSTALTAMSVLYTAKFAGRNHVQVTLPVTARTNRTVRRTPGMMANYPPLAVRVEPGDTVESFVRSVGRAILRTIKHQRYRVQSIRNLAGFHQSDHVAFGPYVNVIPQEPALRFGEATATLHNVSTGSVDDLMFTFMTPAGGGLDIHVNGNPALHSAAQVEAHAARLSGLLRRALSQLSAAVADLPLLAAGDPAIAGDAGPTGPLQVPDVVQSIHRVASNDPSRTAVRDDEGDVSYLELTVQADAVARLLQPGTVAAVVASPGRHFVTALIAALQAGSAWTPIDVESPPERRLMFVGDSGASVILTTAEYLTDVKELAAAAGIDTVIQIDALVPTALTRAGVGAFAVHPAAPDSVAYIMFTSGTTGRPKGAMVHRAGLLNHLLAKGELLDLGTADVVMQNAPVTFDVSVWQMLAPLLYGGITRPVFRATAGDPSAIAEIIASEGLTHLELVPSFARVALEYFDAIGARPFDALKTLMLTGEALPVDLCGAIHERYPSLPVINAYGPTECSDDVAHAVLLAGRKLGFRVPIGVPIRNTRLLVLGHDLLPVPDGVVGELYVAGDCVGPGYLADPVKTAWAFTALPNLKPGERAYRTGDRVVRNADGALEFIERQDHQIKINGQRIELGEVEAGLRNLGGVADAAASVTRVAGRTQLVGHVVLAYAGEANADTVIARLRAELAGRTSAHLVPALWSLTDALPLTAHGKVDRKALPDGAQLRSAVASRRATDRGEQAVAVDPAVAAPSTALTWPVSSEPGAGSATAGSVPLPPTPIQRQLADDVKDRLQALRGYSQFVRLSTPPGLTSADVDLLMTRLTEVHPMLAARVDRQGGDGWHLSQRSLGVNGWTSASRGDPAADLADVVASLDIERGVVWRAVLDPDARTVLLAIHHLVVDGVSWRILQSDLERLTAGVQPQPERTSFREWSVDQITAAHHPLVADQERRLWARDRWQPTVRILARTAAVTWAESGVHTERLDAAVTSAALASVEAGYRVHINDILLSALGLALAGEPDLRGGLGGDTLLDVEVEGHGREDLSALLAGRRVHDLGRTVGWFTTNYPVSVRVPAGGRSVAQVRSLVAHVHEQTAEMVAHGLTHGLSRWLDAGSAQAVARRPVPSIGFNYLGRFHQGVAGGGQFALLPATGDGEAVGTAAAGDLPLRHRVEVTPAVWDTPKGPELVTSWRYDATTLTADRIERLASAWHDAIAAVVAAGDPSHPAPPQAPAVATGREPEGTRDEDARERWRAHLFGVPWDARLGVPAAPAARPERLPVALDEGLAASLAHLLSARHATLRPLLYVAWAGALAGHSGCGEAVIGVEFPLEAPSAAPSVLLPLRVRLRPGEEPGRLVSRIEEELGVLGGAAGLSLAAVLDAVPGSPPDWTLDTAVLLRETPESPRRPSTGLTDGAVGQQHPEPVLTLVVTPHERHACDLTLHFDGARMAGREAAEHGGRFVASLAALLDGRVPPAFRPGHSAGARILPRRAESTPGTNQNTIATPVPADTIAAAMGRVLGRAEVGPDDGFFALGGDSISVISLVSELREGGHEVQVRDIYLHRTPRELAAASQPSQPSQPSQTAPGPGTAAPADAEFGNLLGLDRDELDALEAELGF